MLPPVVPGFKLQVTQVVTCWLRFDAPFGGTSDSWCVRGRLNLITQVLQNLLHFKLYRIDSDSVVWAIDKSRLCLACAEFTPGLFSSNVTSRMYPFVMMMDHKLSSLASLGKAHTGAQEEQ